MGNSGCNMMSAQHLQSLQRPRQDNEKQLWDKENLG